MDPGPVSLISIIDFNLIFLIIGILFLLFCSALVSGAEVAIFSLNRKEIDDLISANTNKGKQISRLLETPKKLSMTFLVANNFLNITIVVLFSYFGNRVFSEGMALSTKVILEIAIVAVLILFFGEVLPKMYATRNNVKFAKGVSTFVVFLTGLLTPVSVPLRQIILYLHKKIGKEKENFSVDQLSQALEMTDYGDATKEEQKILEGIVTFGNTEVRQVMSPRIDVFALNIEETFEEIFAKIVDKGYSRIPVYKEDIDHIEGVLFVKDLIPHIDKTDFEWQALLRSPFFVPENKKLDNLLKEFQGMKNHLAIVVDEYGGTSGLISLEDILEEIVGDISDEFDDEDIVFSQIDAKNFLFEGKISLKDFYRIVPVDEEVFEANKGESETLAGFILEISGNFPKKHQKINFADCIFTVESVDKRRVKQIKVTLL
ncbi:MULTISPECIES: gliding motility-associated protein GldE [unclassified Flavobacterium]|uniref:gliding motility-associated protein GldE n=1 Tax=unclassified Flavobacterium TaxID=196869 RepID=UPI00086A47E7|nr:MULTISPECIES: gliding motility-associated protein GldE [unclassified Flavobacterium]MBN9285259.1 gliding motility-associated protein GldE [Flavobacterium sp.]ODS81851.1 MAG: magnesium/cobalt efflux protein [Chryseobacterium sp. SCN 40-13]OJV72025.1 MAG: magnesium/cobalt efflux protein [Flavobacterium sp. 40-81]